MTPPFIKCACCDGTGKRELEPSYQRTLKIISTQFMPISAKNLQEKGRSINAIAMRCLRLESMGLIRRVGKDGKFILWEAVKPDTQRNSTK